MTSLPTRRARSTSRRLGGLALSAALALSLAACGNEDDDSASDPAPTSVPADDADTDETTSEDAGETGDTSETTGELPEWAPVIETDDTGSVTGLDFTDTPEPGTELEIAVVEEGDGAPVEVGQTITANYFGSVYQGEEPFDESFSSAPFQAPIGVGSLIQGWDQSLPGVPVGSRVIMSIPSDLGYGDAGSPPAIPGGATLYFVIDILEAA